MLRDFCQYKYPFTCDIFKYKSRMREENNADNENERLVQEDPFGPSYPQSAARFFLYRLVMVAMAIVMIMVGKSSLPSDGVRCIEDVVLEFLWPITSFYKQEQVFGRILLTISQLLVDLQLVGMLAYWYLFATSFRYPMCLACLGIMKVMLNALFRTVTIHDSFTQGGYIPSLIFGENFENAYFFSGTSALMVFHICELIQLKKQLLWKLQVIFTIFIIYVLFSFQLNFFMDVMTGLVFGHLVFRNVAEMEKPIVSSLSGFFDGVRSKLNGSPQQKNNEME